jgi:hypothetical protein
MIDQRAPEKNGVLKIVSLVGGHEDNLVKSLLVSLDESVIYTGGSDGLMCIWDIG